MKNSHCPWCGHKINRFKDRQGVRQRKTPFGLRFARCSHCCNYYGQNIKSKRNIIAFICICLLILLSFILQNGYIIFISFIPLYFVITSPLEKMTYDEEVFKEIKNYEWGINTDSLSKRYSYYNYRQKSWVDEDFVVTDDKKYGILFYNINEVSMCAYQCAIAIYSSDNINEPLVDLKPIGTALVGLIWGYKRYYYAPLSDCIITICCVDKGEYPILLIKPSEKKFAIIPFNFTSIYYHIKEVDENKIILQETDSTEIKRLEEKGYVNKTGKQFILSDLNWYDITEYENIEKIYRC